MSNFSDAADRFAGEEPVVLVELSDGVTTYRWSDGAYRDETNGVEYDPRIRTIGQLDRVMDIGAPRPSDLTIDLINTDNSLDSLFSDYSTFSPSNATATIKMGFRSLAVADFETMATMTYARVVGVDDDRILTMELVEDPDRALGEIKVFTEQEVYDALTTAAAATYPALADLVYGDRPVPIVIGRYPLNRIVDGVDIGPSFSAGTAIGGQTFNGMVRMVAISRGDFSTFRMKAMPVRDGIVPFSSRNFWDNYWLSTNPSITWDTQAVTLGGVTWYVLVVKLRNTISEEGGITSGGTWRFSCEPFAPDRIIETDWRVAECVKGVVQSAENFTTWAAKADATSWATVDAHTGTRERMIIRETRRTVDVLDEILTQARIDSYMNKDGKLAGFWLEATPGGSPDYSGNVQLTEDDDVLNLKGALVQHGRWSIANVVTAHYADEAWLGGALGEWLEKMETITGRSLNLEGKASASASTALENQDSRDDHGKWYSADVGGPLLYMMQDSIALARHELALRPDPRWAISANLPWRAAQLELGEITEFSHTAVPAWAADRACVVYSIAYDLQAHRATVRLIDFDDYLRGKVSLYSSMDSWVIDKGSADNVTASVTQSSAVIVMSDGGDWDDALQDDIFEIETDDNQWQGLIESIDDVGPAYSITIRSTGGGDGPTLADIVTEATTLLWRVIRGQSNRTELDGLYVAAMEDKYGCYGASDGFFRDDSTPAYTYQR